MKQIKTIAFESEECEKEFTCGPHFRLIILVIASSSTQYDSFNQSWESYMNSVPNVRSFFLYADDTIETDVFIARNSITYKCKESYIPGILYKTMAGFYVCKKYLNFDFILRTNLSSFIHIPRLLDRISSEETTNAVITRLEALKITNEYPCTSENGSKLEDPVAFKKQTEWYNCTDILVDYFEDEDLRVSKEYFLFFGGCFMLFTEDLIDILLSAVILDKTLEKANIVSLADDIVLTMILLKYACPTVQTMVDDSHQCKGEEDPAEYPENMYHIRNRSDYYVSTRDMDVENMKAQVAHYYKNK